MIDSTPKLRAELQVVLKRTPNITPTHAASCLTYPSNYFTAQLTKFILLFFHVLLNTNQQRFITLLNQLIGEFHMLSLNCFGETASGNIRSNPHGFLSGSPKQLPLTFIRFTLNALADRIINFLSTTTPGHPERGPKLRPISNLVEHTRSRLIQSP